MKNKIKKKQNILERFLNRDLKKGKKDIKQNKITIFYDTVLEEITGIPFEQAMNPEGFTFTDFLHSLFISYPDISKKIPPGKLGFLLNGNLPQAFDILRNGDKVELRVTEGRFKLTKGQIGAVRKEIEAEISDLIEKYEVNITFEKIKEVIFNEKDYKDFHSVINAFSEKIKDLDEGNDVLDILTKAWNFFPHKSLGGSSPSENPPEFQKNNPYQK